jgi:hypothetical protein
MAHLEIFSRPIPSSRSCFSLGTIGCTPACDRYFILGFRHAGLSYARFSKGLVAKVLHFYREHAGEFQETHDAIKKRGGISYPPMKLVDMYFWELGYKLLPEAETDETTNEA